jgi:hypothetical protein
MKTKILILIPEICTDYKLVLDQVKFRIVHYFGTKFAKAEEIVPVVSLDCAVTQEDMQKLHTDLHKDVNLAAILNYDSKQVEGDIVTLTKED